MKIQGFSVLMSVYHKECADYFRSALESVFVQTVLPSEVVVVEDGALTPELNEIVREFEKSYNQFKRVKLPQNVGLGRALNEGLKHCSFELVARMDTDDIARPTRFERQLEEFRRQPELAVCGTWISEFVENPDAPTAVRKVPQNNEDIYEFGKSRNPMNHVTVMFRKQGIVSSGGYQDYPLFEDYYLWVRMLVQGYKFYSIPDTLVDVRADEGMIARRGGLKYAMTEARLQCLFYGMRYISFGRMLKNIAVRFTARVMPGTLRTWLYRRKLRG